MRKFLLLLPLFSLALWVACDKDPNPTTDNRDSYVGQYKLHQTGVIFSGTDGLPVDTMIVVTVAKSGDANITLLDADIKVNSEGRFGAFNTGDCVINPVSNYNVFCGYFKQDSLVFETYKGTATNGSQFMFKGIKQ